MNKKKIIEVKRKKLCKWVSLSEKLVKNNKKINKYYSFKQHDYVSILAKNKVGKYIFVKQFRPAIESYTIELPGGLKDNPKESHKEAAIRELYEETGYITKNMKFLGKFCPDTGRLENNLYCYFAEDLVYDKKHIQEKNVKKVELNYCQFIKLLKNKKMKHFLHIGIIGLAVMNNIIKVKLK